MVESKYLSIYLHSKKIIENKEYNIRKFNHFLSVYENVIKDILNFKFIKDINIYVYVYAYNLWFIYMHICLILCSHGLKILNEFPKEKQYWISHFLKFSTLFSIYLLITYVPAGLLCLGLSGYIAQTSWSVRLTL